MKWIAGILLLCNAGLFLWNFGTRPDATEFVRPPVNGETMMLLSEMMPAQSAPRKQTKKQPENATAVELPVEPTLCLRIGPFHDINEVTDSGDRLKQLSLPFESRTVKAREIRAYRVYIGPFSNQQAIEVQRQLLNESGVTDHYVKRQAGEKDIISLGLFSQNTGADALVRDLKSKTVTALTRVEERTLSSTHWLELRDSKANRAARAQLSSLEWGDERTKLSEFPCS